jgi:hypothetical protein
MRKIITIWVGSVAFIISSFSQENISKEATDNLNILNTSVKAYEAKTAWQKTTMSEPTTKNFLEANPDKTDSYLSQLQNKLKEAKRNNGKEYFTDGKLKLAVNLGCLEAYYQMYDQIDTLTWSDLLQSWQSESIYDLYQSYVNYKFGANSLSEINNNLAEKLKERESQINNIKQEPNVNFISNVEIEDP